MSTPEVAETLEEIAHRITAPFFDGPQLPTRFTAYRAILSALRNERERAFDQGYVCAVANIMTLHGEEVIARDVLNQNRPKDWSIINASDRKALQPIFDHEKSLGTIRKGSSE